MYPKGGNMLHTIRQLVGDDEKWRGLLRGLNHDFRHQIVTGQQVQDYISQKSGIDLSKVFEQYLKTTDIPVLEYQFAGGSLRYRWTNVVDGFDMPMEVTLGGANRVLQPTEEWQSLGTTTTELKADPDYYVEVRQLTP